MKISPESLQKEIEQYFYFIANYYNEESDFSLSASFQFRFTHENLSYYWFLSVDGADLSYGPGDIENPDITIFTSYFLWLQISSGEKNATAQYLKKSYTIKGPLKSLLSFNRYFGSIVKKSRLKLDKRPDPWEVKKGRTWNKPDSVLIINASPRKEKGFTYRYLKPFVQGLSDQAANVEVINLYKSDLVVEPCRGCELCWKKRGECFINDDGDLLIQKV